jgi:hypothetical protein
MFWLTITLALASSRLAIEMGQAAQIDDNITRLNLESTVAKPN